MMLGDEWSKRWLNLQKKQEQIDHAESNIKKSEKRLKELKNEIKKCRVQLRVLINSTYTK